MILQPHINDNPRPPDIYVAGPSNNNNNNNNNNDNNNDNLNNNSSLIDFQRPFASSPSSPSLQDPSQTISFSSLNVRGINNPSKFDAVLQDCFSESFSVIGLQETKLSERNAHALFKNFSASLQDTYLYRAYWSFDSSDAAGGVCLILADFISKYVQKIHKNGSRFIAADLYLPNKKLKIINFYGFQKHDYLTKDKDLCQFTIDHIKTAIKDGFHIIVMEDFNASPDKYIHQLEQGRSPLSYV